MSKSVKFTIECEMKDRWVDDFCSMIKVMESYGDAGHSEWVALFADGDGDFRPKFNINTDFVKKEPVHKKASIPMQVIGFDTYSTRINLTMYDAG